MKRFTTTLFAVFAVLLVAVAPSFATPINGLYKTPDLPGGGPLLTGRVSFWRPTINSGFPHVLHVQSWDGTSLGTQWEISCPSAPSYVSVVDNRVNGQGTIVYNTVYTGGTFTFFSGGWPWGDGTGTLGTTTTVTTDQYVTGVPYPVASVVNGNSSGQFSSGCALTFAIANGAGAGQTTSLAPSIVKPADYPSFYDGTCALAPPSQQFGGWGTVTQITFMIDCVTPTQKSTWGTIKTMYR